jgi:hypothetical protein
VAERFPRPLLGERPLGRSTDDWVASHGISAEDRDRVCSETCASLEGLMIQLQIAELHDVAVVAGAAFPVLAVAYYSAGRALIETSFARKGQNGAWTCLLRTGLTIDRAASCFRLEAMLAFPKVKWM